MKFGHGLVPQTFADSLSLAELLQSHLLVVHSNLEKLTFAFARPLNSHHEPQVLARHYFPVTFG